MKRYLALLVAALIGLGASASAQAQLVTRSHLKAILESGTLRVGTTGDFNPMSFRDAKTNDYLGHDIDAAQQLAKDMGVKVQFVPTTWATLITGLDADQYDIVMTGTSVSPQRALASAFTIGWGKNAFVPLVQKANAGKFHSWADLNQGTVTIGTNLGTTMESFVKQTLPNAKLRSVEAPARDWQELLSGRVDATMSSLIEAAFLTKEYPDLAAILQDQPQSPIPMAFMIVQNDPIWLDFLNNWIELRRTSGYFDTINKKWGVVAQQ
jgi:cyclohexadienyl dehydratase